MSDSTINYFLVLTILRVPRKFYKRISRYMPWHYCKPLISDLEIFSCVQLCTVRKTLFRSRTKVAVGQESPNHELVSPMGSFTYYVISRGGGGGFQMLTVDYGGGGGGLVVDYVIKIFIFYQFS